MNSMSLLYERCLATMAAENVEIQEACELVRRRHPDLVREVREFLAAEEDLQIALGRFGDTGQSGQ